MVFQQHAVIILSNGLSDNKEVVARILCFYVMFEDFRIDIEVTEFQKRPLCFPQKLDTQFPKMNCLRCLCKPDEMRFF